MKTYAKPTLGVVTVATPDIIASSPINGKDALDKFIEDNGLTDYETIPAQGGGGGGVWEGGAD